MILSEKVKQYYMDNFLELPQDKQFHFASRLAAWNGEQKAQAMLGELRDYLLPEGSTLTKELELILNAPQTGKRNAHELRAPFFARYPSLYGVHGALFRLRHIKAVLGIDASEELFSLVNRSELDEMADRLLSDPQSIRILSTFAVNFLYLYRVITLNQSIDPRPFLATAAGYDRSDPFHIQLLIYLYTHCIIGQSNFYTWHIPANTVGPIHEMLSELEAVIEASYKLINLDNKLEFLVCCRIAGFDSKLVDRIYDECEQSISDEGCFLIDRHNNHRQSDRSDFVKSEHRNVLYIMSNSPYQPHSILIK